MIGKYACPKKRMVGTTGNYVKFEHAKHGWGAIMHGNVPRGPPNEEPGGNSQNAGRNDLMCQMAFLQNRFNLTRAEAGLVLHLATGISLKSSANVLGVSYETVRRHLKSAFLKTETHRQAELLLIVIRALDEMI
jgi:DNA-binding CsgD family transcriptional regulator